MNNNIKELIEITVNKMVNNCSSSQKLQNLKKTHDKKIHFVPIRYRIFGGILHSLNIQFGNFIEELMATLVSNEENLEILTELNGKKNMSFYLSKENDERIDEYITKCQTEEININEEFPKLLRDIISCKQEPNLLFKHDIDLIFKNKFTNIVYYVEIKYNDDHDTGKFVDINRKLIKTYAYLTNKLQITNTNQLVPILFFFNNKKMKGNIYIPENSNIKRGKKFFEDFLTIKYFEIDEYMKNLSEKPDVINVFNELYKKIMTMK